MIEEERVKDNCVRRDRVVRSAECGQAPNKSGCQKQEYFAAWKAHVCEKWTASHCPAPGMNSGGTRFPDSSTESWNPIFEKPSDFWIIWFKLLKHCRTKIIESCGRLDAYVCSILWGPCLPVMGMTQVWRSWVEPWKVCDLPSYPSSLPCSSQPRCLWTSQTCASLGSYALAVLSASSCLLPGIFLSNPVPSFKHHLLSKAVVANGNSLPTSTLPW